MTRCLNLCYFLVLFFILADCDKGRPIITPPKTEEARRLEEERKQKEGLELEERRKEKERLELEESLKDKNLKAQTAALKFANLNAWTDEVLKWDESTTQAAINYSSLYDLLSKNKIDAEEFDKALGIFVEQTKKGTLGSKFSWLKHLSPSADFYNINHSGETEEIYYGQKFKIPANSNIIVMGDFHGSLHSLIRNFWRLLNSGYINNEFKITKDNTYIVFTGDFVDRGRYSIETLYSLLRLKLANFDHVFLIRGNHELKTTSYSYGLFKELKIKYGDALSLRIYRNITRFFNLLPVVLFAEVDGKEPAFLHFSHGGFSYNAAKEELVHSPTALLNDKEALYELIPENNAHGYMWSDFLQYDKSEYSQRGFNPDAGVGQLGKDAVVKYFKEISDKTGKKLAGIFRGHQDQAFGVKMLFKNMPSDAEMILLKKENKTYPHGPFHWPDVVQNADKIAKARTEGIVIEDYRPVITFTTAAEGQAVPFDSYGIIKIKDAPKDYSLEIHETELVGRIPDRSYVTITSPKSPTDDGIHVTWSDKGPGNRSPL